MSPYRPDLPEESTNAAPHPFIHHGRVDQPYRPNVVSPLSQPAWNQEDVQYPTSSATDDHGRPRAFSFRPPLAPIGTSRHPTQGHHRSNAIIQSPWATSSREPDFYMPRPQLNSSDLSQVADFFERRGSPRPSQPPPPPTYRYVEPDNPLGILPPDLYAQGLEPQEERGRQDYQYASTTSSRRREAGLGRERETYRKESQRESRPRK